MNSGFGPSGPSMLGGLYWVDHQKKRRKLVVFYLDACEVLLIDPFENYERTYLSKRIDNVVEYYNNEISTFFASRMNSDKTEAQRETKKEDRKAKKRAKNLVKNDFKVYIEATSSIELAKYFFLTMTEEEFKAIKTIIILELGKYKFNIYQDTVSEFWQPKKQIKTNSKAFKLVIKKQERWILILLLIVLGFFLFTIIYLLTL